MLPSRSQIEETSARCAEQGVGATTGLPMALATRSIVTGAGGVPEQIVDGNELSNINYLMLGLVAARAVGRIAVRRDGFRKAWGTGFLAAPGVLVTNEHVLRDAATVAESTVQFRYELDARGDELDPVEFALVANPAPIIDRDLDLAIVAVADRSIDGVELAEFGWLHLDPRPRKARTDEFLTIIQHPGGKPKQICIRENRLVAYDVNEIHMTYTSDTVPGSSGAPVFNNAWDVVALHHSGVPKKAEGPDGQLKWVLANGMLIDPPPDGSDLDDLDIVWAANEGVRISAIARALDALRTTNPLVERVLDAPPPPLPPAGSWPQATSQPPSPATEHESTTTGTDASGAVTVPLELTIGLRVAGGGMSTATITTPTITTPTPPEPGFLEARATPADFADRAGYDPDFLGGDLHVPLPTLSTAQLADLTGTVDGDTFLHYGTFTVQMCWSRSLAYYSAANLDRTRKVSTDRNDSWRNDPRLTRGDQIGQSYYDAQGAHDPAAEDSPFDRGHLTRFADTTWGSTQAARNRNGRDSFHFPNCAPQHEQFNQDDPRSGIWWRVEDWCAALGTTGRVCLINGPIFDAPKSKKIDGNWQLQPNGNSSPDPVYGGVPVPKQFFKIAAFEDSDGGLAVQAFVVTQEALLKTTVALQEALTDTELRLYRVKLTVLEHLTGMDFGPLTAPGVNLNETATPDIERITSIGQL